MSGQDVHGILVDLKDFAVNRLLPLALVLAVVVIAFVMRRRARGR